MAKMACADKTVLIKCCFEADHSRRNRRVSLAAGWVCLIGWIRTVKPVSSQLHFPGHFPLITLLGLTRLRLTDPAFASKVF